MFLFFPLFLLGISKVSAQELPQVVAPSPQTELLVKNLNYREDNSKGIVNVSIPIYTIKTDGLEIPISLDYTTAGIKHAQVPGELGLGWTLSANYRISRTIYGKPDETYDMPSGNLLQSVNNISNNYIRDGYLATFARGFETIDQMPNVSEHPGYNDGEYDIFNYYSPTASGYYFISDRGALTTTMINSADNSKIETTHHSGSFPGLSFEVIDPRGNQYNYGLLPNIYEYVDSPDAYAAATALPLTGITTPGGDYVSFSYIMGQSIDKNSNRSQFTARESTMINSQSNGSGGSIDNTLSGRYSDTFYRDSMSRSMGDLWGLPYQIFYADQIQYNGIQVKFLRSGNRITSIEIWKNSALFEKYDLEYSGTAFSNGFTNNFLTKVKKGTDYEYNLEYCQGNQNSTARTDVHGFNMDTSSGQTYFHDTLENDPLDNNGSVENPLELDRITTFAFGERDYSSNFSVPNFFSLKKITYPTKGSTEFVYENHKGANGRLGGVRLKRILNYDIGGDLKKSTHYKYGANEDGNGFYLGYKYGTNQNDFVTQSYEISYFYKNTNEPNAVDFNGLKTYSTHPIKNDPVVSSLNRVFYPEVAVYRENVNSIPIATFNKNSNTVFDPMGKTIYGYQENSYETTDYVSLATPSGSSVSTMGRQYYSIFTLDYLLWKKSPLVFEKNYREASGQFELISETTYNYSSIQENTFKGLKVASVVSRPGSSEFDGPLGGGYSAPLKEDINYRSISGFPNYYAYISSFFDYSEYNLRTGTQLLTMKTTKEYLDSGETFTSVQEYDYNDRHQQIAVKTNDSKGGNQFGFTLFPADFSNSTGFIGQMKQENLLDYPIEQVSYKELSGGGSKVMGGTVIEYLSDTGLPTNIYNLERSGAMDALGFKFSNRPQGQLPTLGTNGIFAMDPKYTLESELGEYDTEGNLREYIEKQDRTTTYLWGYDRKNLIAKIENASLVDVKGVLGATYVDNTLASSSDQNVIRSAMSNLRTGLPKAMVTTYLYYSDTELLSEIVDPGGISETYHYDDQHRLEFVKDHNANTLSETKYNYKD